MSIHYSKIPCNDPFLLGAVNSGLLPEADAAKYRGGRVLRRHGHHRRVGPNRLAHLNIGSFLRRESLICVWLSLVGLKNVLAVTLMLFVTCSDKSRNEVIQYCTIYPLKLLPRASYRSDTPAYVKI